MSTPRLAALAIVLVACHARRAPAPAPPDETVTGAPVEITSVEIGGDPVDGLLRDTVRSGLVARGLYVVAVDAKDRTVHLSGQVTQEERAEALDVANEALRGSGVVRDAMVVVAP